VDVQPKLGSEVDRRVLEPEVLLQGEATNRQNFKQTVVQIWGTRLAYPTNGD
jgi:hypothetical protein